MAERDDKRKMEIDADEMIRDYVESGDQPAPETQEEDKPTQPEWYDQARQETPAPAEAVLTGGDIDAAWDQASVGDETVGGSSPTPDQDIVDEIGRALGVTYGEGEPLRTAEKIERRDEQRWELNPASSEDYGERIKAAGELQAPTPKRTTPKRRLASGKRGKRKAA